MPRGSSPQQPITPPPVRVQVISLPIDDELQAAAAVNDERQAAAIIREEQPAGTATGNQPSTALSTGQQTESADRVDQQQEPASAVRHIPSFAKVEAVFSRRTQSSGDEEENAAELPAEPLFPELRTPTVQNLARLALPQSWAVINAESTDQPASASSDEPAAGPSTDRDMPELAGTEKCD